MYVMKHQGCSLGLERLGLETVSRRFFDRIGLVEDTVTPMSRPLLGLGIIHLIYIELQSSNL